MPFVNENICLQSFQKKYQKNAFFLTLKINQLQINFCLLLLIYTLKSPFKKFFDSLTEILMTNVCLQCLQSSTEMSNGLQG